MKVEDFLLKKYRCRCRQLHHQAVIWPIRCRMGAGAVKDDPEEVVSEVLRMTTGAVGDRLPLHSVHGNYLFAEGVKGGTDASTATGRRLSGRMFRWIKGM